MKLNKLTFSISDVKSVVPALVLAWLFFLPVNPALAQSPAPFAKAIVDTLSSPHFSGRGYVNDGDGRTAKYITNQFKALGLSPVAGTYQQPFTILVDVFPETPELAVNGKSLTAGIDFLPYPGSAPAEKQTLNTMVRAGSGVFIPQLNLNDYQSANEFHAGNFVVIDQEIADSIKKHPDIPPRLLSSAARAEIARRLGAQTVILLTSGPLTYGYSPFNLSVPTLVVKKSSWPADADSISLSINTHIDWPTDTANVLAQIDGTDKPDSYIVLTAHYDHLGSMGDVYFPGANDNASGIAMLVTLAKHFKANPLEHSIVFIAFTGEEQGLKGAFHFAEHPLIPLENIRFLINLDMVASAKQGIMAVGGSDYLAEFELLSQISDSLNIAPLGKRPNAPNSDHYPFLEKGVRGFFIYTNKGDQPYHHILDIPDTLNWDDFKDVYDLVSHFLKELD